MLQVEIGTQERHKMVSRLNQVTFRVYNLVHDLDSWLQNSAWSELCDRNRNSYTRISWKSSHYSKRAACPLLCWVTMLLVDQRDKDLHRETAELKEKLTVELKSKDDLEKRLENVSVCAINVFNISSRSTVLPLYPSCHPKGQMQISIQRFNELTISTMEYSRTIKEKISLLEDEMVHREAKVSHCVPHTFGCSAGDISPGVGWDGSPRKQSILGRKRAWGPGSNRQVQPPGIEPGTPAVLATRTGGFRLHLAPMCLWAVLCHSLWIAAISLFLGNCVSSSW